MTHCVNRALVAIGIGLALTVGATVDALAHVEIDVGDGQYVMEVGFRDEPAYLGQPNALALRVEQYATGGTEPVNDLAATLSAEVSKDGQVMNLLLVPVGDGEYEGAFVPTATGDYTFRISGTVGEATKMPAHSATDMLTQKGSVSVAKLILNSGSFFLIATSAHAFSIGTCSQS